MSLTIRLSRLGLLAPYARRCAAILVATCAAWLVVCALPARAWDDVSGPALGSPEAIGRYAAGCLVGAERLPIDGSGYQAVNVARNRHYGHPVLVDFIAALARRTADAGIGLLPVGDLSQPRGGPMIHAHASHQLGLDVDIYFRLDLERLPADERDDLDLYSVVDGERLEVNERFREGHATMLRIAASDPRVARIFVNPAIKQALCERDWPDRSFLRTLRPWYGHDDHMHVRLHCPPGSADCFAQPAPSPGDGCGAEVAGWLDDGPIPRRPPGERRMPTLSPRCDALLD
jgi:penicillin-insensitive murein endopeptidase